MRRRCRFVEHLKAQTRTMRCWNSLKKTGQYLWLTHEGKVTQLCHIGRGSWESQHVGQETV